MTAFLYYSLLVFEILILLDEQLKAYLQIQIHKRRIKTAARQNLNSQQKYFYIAWFGCLGEQ